MKFIYKAASVLIGVFFVVIVSPFFPAFVEENYTCASGYEISDLNLLIKEMLVVKKDTVIDRNIQCQQLDIEKVVIPIDTAIYRD